MRNALEKKIAKQEVYAMDGADEFELPYLLMSNVKYYSLTLLLYIVCILGAILIQDIAIVFNFVGAFGLSLTSFALPGLIYLKLMKDMNVRLMESTKSRKWNVFGAYLMIVICCTNIIFVVIKSIVWLIDA